MARMASFDHFVLFSCTMIFRMNSRGKFGVSSIMSVYCLVLAIKPPMYSVNCLIMDVTRHRSFVLVIPISPFSIFHDRFGNHKSLSCMAISDYIWSFFLFR